MTMPTLYIDRKSCESYTMHRDIEPLHEPFVALPPVRFGPTFLTIAFGWENTYDVDDTVELFIDGKKFADARVVESHGQTIRVQLPPSPAEIE